MLIAILLFFVVVLLYAGLFIAMGGNESEYVLRLLVFLAAVVSGGMTLIGVGLTIMFQHRANDKMLQRNEELSLLIQRRDHMPIVECGVESCSIEDDETNLSSDVSVCCNSGCACEHCAWLRVRGDNPAGKVTLRIFDINDYDSRTPLLTSEWLREGDGIIKKGIRLEDCFNSGCPDEASCVLTYQDSLGNMYWRYYPLSIRFENESDDDAHCRSFKDANISLGEGSKAYCETDRPESSLLTYLMKEQETHRKFELWEEKYKERLNELRHKVKGFDALQEASHGAAWGTLGNMRQFFSSCFREKLQGGGSGGGQVLEARKSRMGKYLYLTFGYGTGFYPLESEFSRIDIAWSVTTKINVRNGVVDHIVKKSVRSVDFGHKPTFAQRMKVLKMKVMSNFVRPRTIGMFRRLGYWIAKKI